MASNVEKRTPYIKPSDARSWNHCRRRVRFDHFPPEGSAKVKPSAFDQLVMEMGLAHELKVKLKLEKQYHRMDAASPQHTQDLMQAGIPLIYHPKFIDETAGIIAEPDFLIRTDSGEYQVADAKLAKRNDKEGKKDKKAIQIQLAVYRKMLKSTLPALVFHPNDVVSEVGDEANKLAEKFLKDMRALLSKTTAPEVRYGETKCNACPYIGKCKPEFIARQELTLLYGVDSRSAPGLEAQEIRTIQDLADTDPNTIKDVPYLKGYQNKFKATLQAKAYFTHQHYQIADLILPRGSWVHFDIETNPLTPSGKEHVYLWGLLKPPYDRGSFEYIWTDSEAEDRNGWLTFLAAVERLKAQYPDLILAHFTSFELTNIKRYAKRYDMEKHPTVEWLLGDHSPLFDLQKPVKDSLVLPVASYGLKQICKHEGLVNFQWQDDDSGSQWSVVQFVKYQQEPNQTRREQLKQDIINYNFDDVMGMRALEGWLRGL